MAIKVEQQQKVAEVALSTPLASAIVTTLNDWNVILETATLTLGAVTGLFSAYFLIKRFIREQRAKDKE